MSFGDSISGLSGEGGYLDPKSREEVLAWDEAYEKVENYLRAHRIQSKWVLSQVVPEILRQARSAQPENENVAPVTLASEAADFMMESWFRSLMEPEAFTSAHDVGARGRLALLLSDAPARWPHYMLKPVEELPEELLREFREAFLQAGPDLELARMVPRPIDLGSIGQLAENTFGLLASWPVFKTLSLVAVIGALVGYVFWITH